MIDVVVCSAAEAEYAAALRWYAERSIQAAEAFDAEVDQAIKQIAANPSRFPRCDDQHRFFLMRRFPYQLIYRADNRGVTLLAVAHTSRSPDYWRGRG